MTAREIWTPRGYIFKASSAEEAFLYVEKCNLWFNSKIVDDFVDAAGFVGEVEDEGFFLLSADMTADGDFSAFGFDMKARDIDIFVEAEHSIDLGGDAGIGGGSTGSFSEFAGIRCDVFGILAVATA